MRKLLLKLHLFIALIAGVFILILGATGAVMAFEPELDHLLHARLSYVTPQSHALSLAELGAAALSAFPRNPIVGYSVSTSPDISAQVITRSSVVFVNPYTGEVLGVREPGPDFLSRVHQLHLRLLIFNRADPGKKIMSWAGVAMIFLLFSGLYLWWPQKRASIRGGKLFWFDLHNTIGIFSFVFLFILTFTGLMIGFEETTVPMFYKLTGSEPAKPPSIPPPPSGARPIPVDQAMEIARTAIPGASPFQINVPGPKQAYQVRSRFPEDRTPGGRSRVVIDQYTGKVLFSESSRTAPAGSRMVIQNRAIHTGDIFGIPSKAIMSLACMAVIAQLISGLTLWWRRKT